MPCFHPLRAYTAEGGGVTFKSPTTHAGNPIDLACGQCIGCRLQRASDWALRCVHEAQLHPQNAYVTLTYEESNLPSGGSLQYRDFQLFMKRLRKSNPRRLIRFYMCGEYGDLNKRPHFHACLFNIDFTSDQVYWSKNKNGDPLYTSPTLSKLWPLGHATAGQVTLQSAGYCARYILQKVTGDAADPHYKGRTPEFNRMSLGGRSANGGIGAAWVSRFRSDVFPCDYVVDAVGRKHRVPRYYDRLNERFNASDLDQVKASRELRASDPKSRADNTPSRLRAKEEVTTAATRQLIRPDC